MHIQNSISTIISCSIIISCNKNHFIAYITLYTINCCLLVCTTSIFIWNSHILQMEILYPEKFNSFPFFSAIHFFILTIWVFRIYNTLQKEAKQAFLPRLDFHQGHKTLLPSVPNYALKAYLQILFQGREFQAF